MVKSNNKSTLIELAKQESERLKDDPNITAVGIGLKIKNGKPQMKACLQYWVIEKMPDKKSIKVCNSQLISSEVKGIPTDVIQIRVDEPDDKGPPTGGRGGRQEDPLVGGTSSTVLSAWHSIPTGFGTLGGICFDEANDDMLALSNAHVWGFDTGNDIIQPWMPLDEYLEAVVKLLACGPVIAFFTSLVVPSPLTAGLAAAATGAWIAASASDAEDPVRWGQRTSPLPSANATTISEKVRIESELPPSPFAGRPYSAKVKWDYVRKTDQGDLSNSIIVERKNQHTLKGKYVWTQREIYNGGEQVQICAELTIDNKAEHLDYYVVAHCYPMSNSDRLVKRVLIPGRCKALGHKQICQNGFKGLHTSSVDVQFPFTLAPFEFFSAKPGRLNVWTDPQTGQQVTTLRGVSYLSDMTVRFSPAWEVQVGVFHYGGKVTVKAYNSFGQIVDSATTSAEQNKLHLLKLKGNNIDHIVQTGSLEAFMVSICIKRWPDIEKGRKLYYSGNLTLDLHEPPDRWGITLFVQNVNNIPPGTSPAIAAQTIGGITQSDNVADVLACGTVVLLDSVFDVI